MSHACSKNMGAVTQWASSKWIDHKPSGRLLLLLFLLALLVRVAAVTLVGSFLIDRTTYEHGEIARNLVLGRGFSVAWFGVEGPTSTQAPVYPLLLALWYWLLGIESPLALLAMQLMQALLGALSAPLSALLATELLCGPARELESGCGSRAGGDPLLRHGVGRGPNAERAGEHSQLCFGLLPWLAGLGVAIYPTLIYAVTQIQVAWLAALLTVLTLWLAACALRRQRLALAGLCGLSGGLLILTDPILALVVFVAIAFIAFWSVPSIAPERNDACGPAMHRPRRLLMAGIASAICLLPLCPWLVRNWLVHGQFVPVKSTFGYAFWQGNHPRSWGTDKIPLTAPAARSDRLRAGWLHSLEQTLWRQRLIDTTYIDDVVLSAQRRLELARLSEPQRSKLLLREAIGYVRQAPARYAGLCLRRLAYFLWYDPTNPKARLPLFKLVHGSLTLLSLVGLWLSRRLWRRLWPTYLAFALVTLFHTFTIFSLRFHIPLEPIAILWAAFVPAGAYQSLCLRWQLSRKSRPLAV